MFCKFVGRLAVTNFGQKTFSGMGTKKVTNWSLATLKGKISIFIVDFKFVQPGV